MKKIILLNLYAFLFWIVALNLSVFDLIFLKYLKSFSNLIIILVLVGINLAALIQLFRAELFSKIEILSIASILSLLVAPLLITLEYAFFGSIFPKLPFINSLAIFIFLLIIHHKKKTVNLENFDFLNLEFKKENILKFIKSPFFFAFLTCTASITITFSTFYALPEFDPYYWYFNFQEMVARGTLTPINGYRPLFMSLVYIFNQSAQVDLYAIFKYIIPSLTLIILIPAYLVAKNQNSRLKQLAFLLVPFINASLFLYSQMPIPQAIFNIALFFFTFFLLYSWITQHSLFYFLSGIIILFAYFYHESALIVFLIWCTVTLLAYKENILNFIKNNQLSSFLIFIILILNFSQILEGPYIFLSSQFNKAFFLKNIFNFNFLFPAEYSNIDKNLMGWKDLTGVIKYYIYYVGPTFFITITYFTYFFLRNQQFKKYVTKNLFAKELLVLLVSFFCFFAISEILPRFSGIALLPERSWIFGGIFSIIFLFFIFNHLYINRFLLIILIFSFFINIGGALYINNLKKYVVTPSDINLAEWIKKNLPSDRVLFSSNKKGPLQLYSDSIVIEIPANFFYDLNTYQQKIEEFRYGETDLSVQYSALVNELYSNISDLKINDIKNQRETIANLLEKNSTLSDKISNLLSLPNNENKHNLYIFFSKINENNPYINRPYYKKINYSTDNFIFDKHPDKFKRIYSDQDDTNIIWQIL